MYISSDNKLVAGHNSERISSSFSIPLNTWTHVGVTYDHFFDRITLYANGIIIAAANDFGIWHESNGLYIGGTDKVQTFEGLMCGIKIARSALNPTQFMNIYQS
jgi:hypothetical protein